MSKVPDLVIEKIVLGELPEAEARRLMEDPEVVRRVQELERSNREILDAYPAEEMARRIAGRLESLASVHGSPAKAAEGPGAAQWRRLLVRGGRAPREERSGEGRARGFLSPSRLIPVAGLASLALVAGLVLALVLPGGAHSGGATVSMAEETRVKGLTPHLVVYHKTRSGAEILRENDTVHENDVLQLGYVSAARPYGVILSIDGRGVVTVHFPSGAATAGGLEPKGETLLPFAYELDDAPGFERFFLVTSREPFPVEVVVGAAERLAAEPERARLAPLELPGKLEQSSIVLSKGPAGR